MAVMNIWNTPLATEEQEEREFPVLPAGTYEFEVADITAKAHEAKAGGKIGYCAELDLRLEVFHEGKTISVFDRLYSDPKTAWKMKAFAKCIGLDQEPISPGDILREAKLRGGRFQVGQHEYNGKTQNDVKFYIAPKQEDKPAAAGVPDYSDLPF